MTTTVCLRIRRQAGMTQAELAAALGVDVRNVQRWERGHINPSGAARALLRVLEALPAALDVLQEQPKRARAERRVGRKARAGRP